MKELPQIILISSPSQHFNGHRFLFFSYVDGRLPHQAKGTLTNHIAYLQVVHRHFGFVVQINGQVVGERLQLNGIVVRGILKDNLLGKSS